jgi:hypothetical protein
MRLRERRRYDYASRPPSLSTALRQLRMHVIDAQGPAGVREFADRTRAVALLAEMAKEHEAAIELQRLSMRLTLSRDGRPAIYDALDRVQGVMREYH